MTNDDVEAQRGGENSPGAPSEGVASAASILDLLHHAARDTGDLQAVWSQALDEDAFRAARSEVKAMWSSVLRLYIDLTSRIDLAVGRELATFKAPFPLDHTAIARLEFECPPERRWRQLHIASLYAFESLAEAIQFLDQPTGRRVRLEDGRGFVTEATWWEVAAFALVRDRTETVIGIFEAEQAALADVIGEEKSTELFGRPVAESVSYWNAMTVARGALARGWYVAALPLLMRWLRGALSEALGVSEETLPRPIAAYVAGLPELSDLAPSVEILEIALERLSTGEELDLGVAVPLAEFLADTLGGYFLDGFPVTRGADGGGRREG